MTGVTFACNRFIFSNRTGIFKFISCSKRTVVSLWAVFWCFNWHNIISFVGVTIRTSSTGWTIRCRGSRKCSRRTQNRFYGPFRTFITSITREWIDAVVSIYWTFVTIRSSGTELGNSILSCSLTKISWRTDFTMTRVKCQSEVKISSFRARLTCTCAFSRVASSVLWRSNFVDKYITELIF